jgi:hypothetical protein
MAQGRQFPQVFRALGIVAKAILQPTFSPISTGLDNAAGLLIDAANDTTSFFTNGGALRSYLLRVYGRRPATSPLGAAGEGVDDAALYLMYRSYAADGAGVQQRGLNAQVRKDGASGGSMGNLIGTNAQGACTLAGDCVTLTLSNEEYAAATGGVSGALDMVHTHEGANAAGGEFGVRIRNAKKNGSAIGSFVKIQNDASATTSFKHGMDMQGVAAAGGVSTLVGDIVLGSKDANGLPCIIASGAAANDGAIVAQVGADTLWADGSLYISVVDGGGGLWQKIADLWTLIT